MAEKKFIIEVRTKGFARATRSVRDLEKNTKGYNKAAENMRGQTSGLIGNLGSLRNKILVYTFALGGAAAAIGKFVNASSQFENARVRLEGLTGSAEEAAKSFDNFREIASKTPFQLADVVNAGVTLESFGANANETLESLVDLAAFMQTTATEAASALGRAYAGGAGAADVLKERGFLQIVRDSQGIKDLSKITLPEFRKALINAMADPDGRISGSADRLSKTFSGSVSNMQDAINEFAATVGDLVADDLKDLVNGVEDFFRALDVARLKEVTLTLATFSVIIGGMKLIQFAKSLDVVGSALFRMQATMQLTALATGKFAKAIGFLVAILSIDFVVKQLALFDDLSESMDNSADAADDVAKAVKKVEKAFSTSSSSSKTLKTDLSKVEESLKNQEMALKLQIMALQGATDKQLALAKTNGDFTLSMSDSLIAIKNYKAILKEVEDENAFDDAVKSNIKSLQSEKNALQSQIAALDGKDLLTQRVITSEHLLTEEEKNLIIEIEKITEALQAKTDALEAEAQATQNTLDLEKQFTSLLAQTDEGMKSILQTQIDMVNSNRELFAAIGDVDAVLELLNSKLNNVGEETSDTSNKAQKFAGAINVLSGALKNNASEADNNIQKFQMMAGTLGGLLMVMGGPAAGAGAVLSALSNIPIAHTGGLIKQNGIQRFAQGGQVQGEDNVPILAQAGEFIMKRSAVQNIGVQNLANMNRTGNAGGVTINISGNMIGNDEFVRDNLIPEIQKVSNQGLA